MPDLVALALPAGPLFVEQIQRAWDAGDAVFPVDTRLPPPALNTVLNAVAPSVVVDENGERHERRGVPVEEGDAVVIATSGTTGDPKGVVLTHDAIRASAEITSQRLTVTSNDHWVACLPVAHIGGFTVITKALYANTRLTVLPSFDAAAVESAARAGATLISLVSAAMQRVDTVLFRRILLGGGPPPETRPANVTVTYGMTETGSGIVYDHYALDGVEIQIGESENEIMVRSPTLLRCYRDGSDPRDANGWFPTGDAGTLDESGRLDVFGRIEEVINTGGEKVWPASVERVLRMHPSIGDVVVRGEKDAEWGERVVALVEDDPPPLEEVRELTKQYLPAYAAPREIRRVERLMRTPTGKLRRSSSP